MIHSRAYSDANINSLETVNCELRVIYELVHNFFSLLHIQVDSVSVVDDDVFCLALFMMCDVDRIAAHFSSLKNILLQNVVVFPQ